MPLAVHRAAGPPAFRRLGPEYAGRERLVGILLRGERLAVRHRRRTAAAGADIDAMNGDLDRDTALHRAVTQNRKDAVEYLLRRGANRHLEDSYGYTPPSGSKRATESTRRSETC